MFIISVFYVFFFNKSLYHVWAKVFRRCVSIYFRTGGLKKIPLCGKNFTRVSVKCDKIYHGVPVNILFFSGIYFTVLHYTLRKK